MSTDSEYETARSDTRESSLDPSGLSAALDSLGLDERPRKRLRVLIQDECRQHAYLRDTDVAGSESLSFVFEKVDCSHFALGPERPERLRAVNMGIAAVWARRGGDAAEAMAAQMSRMALGPSESAKGVVLSDAPFEVVSSSDRLPLTAKAVSTVHNEANHPPDTKEAVFPSPAYPQQLSDWIRASAAAHSEGRSEMPSHLPQGDLYLCTGSLAAIEGALGTTCAAVDEAVKAGGAHFAAIRPPGHHCSSDTPSGFCLVNNVMVGAVHAHEQHGVDRVVVFDIDLHHGDGVSQIASRINRESFILEQAHARSAKSTPRKVNGTPRTRRSPSPGRSSREKTPASDLEEASSKRPLQILYTSLHDIESFPCEDGDEERIANASMRILGGHGQWICNVHLVRNLPYDTEKFGLSWAQDAYESENDFHANHYPGYRDQLFDAARKFLRRTAADPARTLVFISAGFDASEHETPYMQRHGKRVPTSFFSRFAADAQALAAELAGDRLVSVLEGGYSDRALMSGMASFLDGFLGQRSPLPTMWDVKTLAALEKAYEGKVPARAEPWLSVAQSAFFALEGVSSKASFSNQTTPTAARELRERKAKPIALMDEQVSPRRANAKAKSSLEAKGKLEAIERPLAMPNAPALEAAPTEAPPAAVRSLKLTFKAGGIT